MGQGVAEALGTVEHDHLVDVAERLGCRFDDGRPVLGQLLTDDRVLVLGQGVGPRLDGFGLGHAFGPHRFTFGAALGLGGMGLGLTDVPGGFGSGAGVELDVLGLGVGRQLHPLGLGLRLDLHPGGVGLSLQLDLLRLGLGLGDAGIALGP